MVCCPDLLWCPVSRGTGYHSCTLPTQECPHFTVCAAALSYCVLQARLSKIASCIAVRHALRHVLRQPGLALFADIAASKWRQACVRTGPNPAKAATTRKHIPDNTHGDWACHKAAGADASAHTPARQLATHGQNVALPVVTALTWAVFLAPIGLWLLSTVLTAAAGKHVWPE
jgi:hypothetical protein